MDTLITKRTIRNKVINLMAHENMPRGAFAVFLPTMRTLPHYMAGDKMQVACALEAAKKEKISKFMIYGICKGLFGPLILGNHYNISLFFNTDFEYALDDFQDHGCPKVSGVFLMESTGEAIKNKTYLAQCAINYPETHMRYYS
jgi:hypothetical protein